MDLSLRVDATTTTKHRPSLARVCSVLDGPAVGIFVRMNSPLRFPPAMCFEMFTWSL